jgi:hypothetical protein
MPSLKAETPATPSPFPIVIHSRYFFEVTKQVNDEPEGVNPKAADPSGIEPLNQAYVTISQYNAYTNKI